MEPEIVELEHGTYCFVRPKGKIASFDHDAERRQNATDAIESGIRRGI